MRTLAPLFLLIFLLTVEGVLAQNSPPAPALSTTRYFITFYPVPATPGAKMPAEREQFLVRCLYPRCTMEKLAAAPECPKAEVCENVKITEARAPNGPGYVYAIDNWLTSGALHDAIYSTKPPQVDYHSVSDVDDARDRALKRIGLQIVCHDQGPSHHKGEVVIAGIINPQPQIQPQPGCECK